MLVATIALFGLVAALVDLTPVVDENFFFSTSDPAFRRGVQSDRRATLSKFRTVKHALADRERIERAKKKT